MSENLTFGLVHGAYHGAWCWDKIIPLLEAEGHSAVALDLPAEDPDANFDDYSDVVVDALKGMDDVVLVGHSRGGNVIPRVAGRMAVRQLIFLGSSFQPQTLAFLNGREDTLPARLTTEYVDGIRFRTDTMSVYEDSNAKNVFYHDCDPEDAEWAVSRLRSQRRSDNEPPLRAWPAVNQDYIICTEDKVVRPEWSREVCKMLGIRTHELASGHSPFLSCPEELTQKILDCVVTLIDPYEVVEERQIILPQQTQHNLGWMFRSGHLSY